MELLGDAGLGVAGIPLAKSFPGCSLSLVWVRRTLTLAGACCSGLDSSLGDSIGVGRILEVDAFGFGSIFVDVVLA